MRTYKEHTIEVAPCALLPSMIEWRVYDGRQVAAGLADDEREAEVIARRCVDARSSYLDTEPRALAGLEMSRRGGAL